MREEIEARQKNRTWERCFLPKGKKVVGCRWIFSIKYKINGSFEIQGSISDRGVHSDLMEGTP